MFVGNLSFDVSREELIEALSAAGKVTDAKLPTDRETGRPRGFAFVEFESDEAAERCIATMNGKDLKGRALRVNEAESRPPRPGGAGPSFRPAGAPGYRPSGPGFGAPPPDFGGGGFDSGGFDRGRPFKAKGSRRNLRRRKRGFY
ncbi:MAG TPA: RNA-binding protein [Vicinamibacteria bacterium]|nr:RNA-binding protein [Vicinamibacteria bacterium]